MPGWSDSHLFYLECAGAGVLDDRFENENNQTKRDSGPTGSTRIAVGSCGVWYRPAALTVRLVSHQSLQRRRMN